MRDERTDFLMTAKSTRVDFSCFVNIVRSSVEKFEKYNDYVVMDDGKTKPREGQNFPTEMIEICKPKMRFIK